MTELFNNNRVDIPLSTINDEDILEITVDKVKHALKCFKPGKAIGPDELRIEIITIIAQF